MREHSAPPIAKSNLPNELLCSCLLAHVALRTSGAVRDVIVKSLSLINAGICALTFDDNLEIARRGEIDRVLKPTSYFVDPYASSQRGTNENTNGLKRQ